MSILLICPHGHQFETADSGPAVCPVCGAAVRAPTPGRTCWRLGGPTRPGRRPWRWTGSRRAMRTPPPWRVRGRKPRPFRRWKTWRCPATRCWACWAAGAWASSTRRGRSSLDRLVALKMILRRRPCRRRRDGPLPPRGRGRRPLAATRTSSRSTTWASTRAGPSWPWNTWKAAAWPSTSRASPCLPPWRRPWCAAGPRHARRPPRRASSTATSSPPISCCRIERG